MPQPWVAQLIFKVRMKFGIALSNKLPVSLRPIVCEELPRRYQLEVHQVLYKVNSYFLGYWSSFRYYEQIEDELSRVLVPPKPENSIAVKM
jgi:hypothetical protein